MKQYDALVLVCVVALGFLLNHALEVQERRDHRQTCHRQLRTLATALEQYSTDNTGAYPQAGLSSLTPNYLKAIPVCPEAQARGYSYEVSTMPDAFTLLCPASHFGYSSYQGMTDR